MSELSQQELAKFFDFFTALSARNVERLSSLAVDAEILQPLANNKSAGPDSPPGTTSSPDEKSVQYLLDEYLGFVHTSSLTHTDS